MPINYKSTLSGLLIPDEPLMKSEFNGPRSYIFREEFDKGVTPQGWTVSTQGPGSSVAWTQAYETGVVGQAFLQANQSAINNRAGVIFANGRNLILRFDDCVYTILRTKVRQSTAAYTGICQVGFGNTITPANVLAGASQTGFGNTIAFRIDQQNRTGENPGLIQNWILFTKKAGVGFNAVDTGVPYTPAVWQDLAIMFDNSIPASPVVRAFINDVEVATISGAAMANVPVNQAAAAGASLQPMMWVGNGGFTGGPSVSYRNGSFSIYRLWN